MRFSIIALALISTAASCPPIDPCKLVQCQPGYHCENGICIQDPVPPDPCEGIVCNPGFHCENGICTQDPTPPHDLCDGVVCDPGAYCVDGKCVIPPPPLDPCPKELAPEAYVYVVDKPYGNGFDSTIRVHGDPQFCYLIHGVADNDCHLEGWENKVQCELKLAGGCPVWQFTPDIYSTPAIKPCNDDHDALASCDHFGNPQFRDDPQTPTSGDTLETLVGFEGEPKECGLQRNEFGPKAGYFTIAHGKAFVRACLPNGTSCGDWKAFDH